MVSAISTGPQIPASKGFEPNQKPQTPYNMGQTDGPALKPQKIESIEKNIALSQSEAGLNSPSELSKLNARGSTLDISV